MKMKRSSSRWMLSQEHFRTLPMPVAYLILFLVCSLYSFADISKSLSEVLPNITLDGHQVPNPVAANHHKSILLFTHENKHEVPPDAADLHKSIPLFTHDDEHKVPVATEQHKIVPLFPKWGPEGISIKLLSDFILGIPSNNSATTTTNPRLRLSFPETPYVVDSRGVWVSGSLRQRHLKGTALDRLKPMELIMIQAYEKLMGDPSEDIGNTATSASNNSAAWHRLEQVVKNHGFPFVSWYGDSTACNENNWLVPRNSSFIDKHSIPIFTVCASVSCNYTFPLPTYKTIRDSQSLAIHWDAVLDRYKRDYPWQTKIRKLVWRGGLTGPLQNYTSPRARLGVFAAQHQTSPVLDIGIADIPDRHNKSEIDLELIGDLKPSISPQDEFQKYVAILDTDGNSWSSRFSKLLCYNSVIVKVEPQFVDYFHFKDLKPWEHYVPVSYDLSDLMERANFVADPANDEILQRIVANANAWCERRMTHPSIADDYLDIWQKYVEYLDLADENWEEEWAKTKSQVFALRNKFAMVKVVPISNMPGRRKVKRQPHNGGTIQ